MRRYLCGALACCAVGAFGLDAIGGGTPNDLVSDAEASRVVGGACGYWSTQYCSGPGTGCTGFGFCGADGESTAYGEGREGSVCGGCEGTIYGRITGCGSGSGN